MALVNVHCIPDNQYAIIGVTNTKRVRFDIETKQSEENAQSKRRIPLNLVLVLDRSGSMSSNNKLTFAKQAVISVLNSLHDDDIVHLVAYDTTVWNVFENASALGRQNLYSVVEGIVTGGETFLSGGIEMGASLLEKYPHPGYSKRMFVLSDGLANVGLRTKEEIVKVVTKYNEQGIIIDSFGVGEDFDADIMKGIAEAGCGQFFFLESAEVIVNLMNKALQSVFDVCGTQAQLIIRGRNNAIVTKIWGYENIAAGANLGDLHVDNCRAILCDFTISGNGPEGVEVHALDYQLKYNLPDDVEGEPLTVAGQLSVIFVNDESLIRHIDPKVQTLHAAQLAREMDDKIVELIKNRRSDDAIALLTEQINLLQQVVHLDDEKGMVAMLIRMAQNLQKKLKDKTISAKAAVQKCGHHGHMKKYYDKQYTKYYEED